MLDGVYYASSSFKTYMKYMFKNIQNFTILQITKFGAGKMTQCVKSHQA